MSVAARLVRTLTLPHRAMRNDAARLAAVLRNLEAGNRLPSAPLLGAFDRSVALVQHHHRMEDNFVFPFVGKRVSSFSRSIESLEEDHVDLEAALARVVSRLRLVWMGSSGSWCDSRHDRLMQDIDRLAAILCAHLDREEDALSPALKELGEDHAQQLLIYVTRVGGIRALARTLPWIISNADGTERRELRESLPRPLLLVHNLSWGPRFAWQMRPLYALDGRD